jgi:hypothetical protein
MPAFTCLAATLGVSRSPLQPVFWKQETGILAQVERDEYMGQQWPRRRGDAGIGTPGRTECCILALDQNSQQFHAQQFQIPQQLS